MFLQPIDSTSRVFRVLRIAQRLKQIGIVRVHHHPHHPRIERYIINMPPLPLLLRSTTWFKKIK